VEALLSLFLVTTLYTALINAHRDTLLQDLINACNASLIAKIVNHTTHATSVMILSI
jgi:hypothetical protein